MPTHQSEAKRNITDIQSEASKKTHPQSKPRKKNTNRKQAKKTHPQSEASTKTKTPITTTQKNKPPIRSKQKTGGGDGEPHGSRPYHVRNALLAIAAPHNIRPNAADKKKTICTNTRWFAQIEVRPGNVVVNLVNYYARS